MDNTNEEDNWLNCLQEVKAVSPVKKTKYSKFDNTQEWRELGFAVAYYRKLRGLTQETLAERVGISLNHLSSIEAPNVNRGVSIDVLFSIAKVLDIKPYQLFYFSELRPKENI